MISWLYVFKKIEYMEELVVITSRFIQFTTVIIEVACVRYQLED